MARTTPAVRGPLTLLRGMLVAMATATCAAGPTEPAAAPNPARVLFIGNSLTEVNDLPRVVQALSVAAGHDLAVAMLAYPNYGLEDHWARPGTHDMVATDDWDVVVLQQGPSALDSSRETLRRMAARFAGRIRDAGGEPALCMVWPPALRADDFQRVSDSYRLAAEDVDGLLLPAGEAWQEAWRLGPAVELYGSDDFHPSQAGTYLAALTIVGRFYDHPLVGLPGTLELEGGGTVVIPEDTAELLQRAAVAALR